jgi:primosomal protein N' (replication factor Y)
LIKIPTTANLGQKKQVVARCLTSFEAIANYRSIRVTLNVDYN